MVQSEKHSTPIVFQFNGCDQTTRDLVANASARFIFTTPTSEKYIVILKAHDRSFAETQNYSTDMTFLWFDSLTLPARYKPLMLSILFRYAIEKSINYDCTRGMTRQWTNAWKHRGRALPLWFSAIGQNRFIKDIAE